MLKQRNIVVLSLLMSSSVLMQEKNGLVSAVKLAKTTKGKDDDEGKTKKDEGKTTKAKDDDEGDKAENKNHPPKEVSHFTQDKVKAWLKRSFWRDNALPTTPSYNDGDEEAYTHPMGSTFAQ